MITRRKVRSDSKLEQLNPAQHEQLISWLDDENCSYTEVVTRVRTEFNFSVGRTAVAAYYQRHVAPLYHDAEAESAAAFAELPQGVFDTVTLNLAKRLAWSALSRPSPQVEKASALLNMVHRAARQTLAERRMALAERRAAILEKEAARRARRRPPGAKASTPVSEDLPLQASPAKPLAPVAAHADAPEAPPYAEAETPQTETPQPPAPSQKILPNPPAYSPYFGLNRDHSRAENAPLSGHDSEPSELAAQPAKILQLYELAEPHAA